MNQQIKLDILNKIKSYQRIIISRHIRPDGDAVGSTKGLCEVLRDSFPGKDILLMNDDYAAYTAFLGGEDVQDARLYADALLIVLDTATVERISNKNYALAKEVIKIDHHVDIAPYGDISWVEDQRSSCCEMIADFVATFRDELTLSKQAATYIYTGMVTDSGRFRFDSTSGETLRLAGMLLDCGVDTETLYANLYLDDFKALKFKAYFLSRVKLTKHGVAYLSIDLATQERLGMTSEEASALVSTMDGIKGSLAWIIFVENRDGTTRVRLRSRYMTINKLGERYHGGGHERAAGATVYSKAEKTKLLREADRLIKEYKETHDAWL